MEVFEAIQKRRSVRSYLPDEVPEEKLGRILEAARLAPSAMGRQPWHFIVVTDPRKRKQLSRGGRFAWFLSEAPVVIVGCGNKRSSSRWHVIDTAIAMQNMVIAATGEGLGTCWIGSFNQEQVKQLLSIPDEYVVISLLAVGYPGEKEDLSSRALRLVKKKKRLEEIVSVEKFGNPFVGQ
jgi:nitroreductase